MSLPWLSEDYKPSKSHSKSPSSDKKSKTGDFGHSVPVIYVKSSRSRSRSESSSSSSRSRSRSKGKERDKRNSPRDRDRGSFFKERGRGGRRPDYRSDFRSRRGNAYSRKDSASKRRRTRSGSGGSHSDSSQEVCRPVASKKLKLMKCRVFVANVLSKDFTKEDLVKHFEKYGEILDLLIHPKNYAFVQYGKEEHARLAVEGENGSTFRGSRMDVKLAMEGKKDDSNRQYSYKGRGRRNDGSELSAPGYKHKRDVPDTEFSRREGPRESRGLSRRGGPRDEKEFNRREGLHDDREFSSRRDPRDEREFFRRDGSRPPLPPFPGEYGMRDPFFPPYDPHFRDYPDSWLPPDDPFRPGPYADTYRASYPNKAPTQPQNIECQIFLVSSKLREYGKTIEDSVKTHPVITGIMIMPEGRTASEMLADFSDKNGLFAIFVNNQNEAHQSLTLNILHGSHQEHRNMPLKAAVDLIGKSFEEYVDRLREKANAGTSSTSAEAPSTSTSASTTISRVFLPPTMEVTYLLNLLADSRALTISELEEVIKYLKERRDKLIDAENRPLASEETSMIHKAKTSESSSKQLTEEELTNKIINIISSSVVAMPSLNAEKIVDQLQKDSKEQYQLSEARLSPLSDALGPLLPPGPSHEQRPKPPGNVINFDNPNVQKALDSLIQSNPDLFKNLGAQAYSASPEPLSIESLSHVVGRSSMKGYNQGIGKGPRSYDGAGKPGQ